MRATASSLVALAALTGCARGPSRPTIFAGETATVSASAEEIREVDVRPQGYRGLGRVWSRCTEGAETSAIDRAWVSDVDCSRSLLVAAIRERAARVGGEVLVALRCTEKGHDGGTTRRCHAQVARPSSEGSARRPLDAKPGDRIVGDADDPLAFPQPLVPYAPASDAWRISVTVKPAVEGTEPRVARDRETVREVAVVPASHVVSGDILARCHGDCARDSVRVAVRAAAARVGADDVVGIDCVRGRPGWVCTGRAAVYEVDPERYPAAR